MFRAALVWFLQDLRLSDNPALADAARQAETIVPVFLWTPGEHGDWAPGRAARSWLHASLTRLDADLRRRGSRLVLRRADSALEALRRIAAQTGADAVTWNARYEPALRERDLAVAEALSRDGLEVRVHRSRILHDPRRIRTAAGAPYTVFTPFWRRMQDATEVGEEIDRPRLGPRRAPRLWPDGMTIDDLGLVDPADAPLPARGRPFGTRRSPSFAAGEAAARERLAIFVAERLATYSADRDRLDLAGTSGLSPHLAHGELSPRQVWNAVVRSVRDNASRRAADVFLRQLAWREFAYHLLFHFPRTPSEPLRERFEAFPWRKSERELRAWKEGQTGYPVVDAAMHQLRHTGWMHNRGRMIVASFLTKHLLVPWQDGARWFWDRLVDADLANNTLGWQWSAGCGADAQPFFRIFNPVSQGTKFDPAGRYVRDWIPQLASVPDDLVHRPWQGANVARETDGSRAYPAPIVDHREARTRALAAWAEL